MALTAQMVTIDCANPESLAAWWADAIGGTVTDYGDFTIVTGQPVSLGFQRVPEPKQGKNRVHLDFSDEDREAAVARLVAMGATAVGEHSVPGLTWTTLRDPEDNEFDVSGPYQEG